MDESVAPIVRLLDMALALPDLRKIVLVSTAYVNPPYPAPISDQPPQLPGNPWTVYKDLRSGRLSWDDLHSDSRFHRHSLTNTYIFGKTLLEHLIRTPRYLSRS